MVDQFGSGRGDEPEKRFNQRDIAGDVVKTKFHGAPVRVEDAQPADIKLGSQFQQHFTVVVFELVLWIGPQDAVGRVMRERLISELQA